MSTVGWASGIGMYCGSRSMLRRYLGQAFEHPKTFATRCLAWAPLPAATATFFVASHYFPDSGGSVGSAITSTTRRGGKLVGQQCPDVELETPNGVYSLRGFVEKKGVPTVVDFYQSHWPACGPDARKLDELARVYKGRANVLLCNMTSLQDADHFAHIMGLRGHALHCATQAEAAQRLYGVRSIPHKVLIGADGVVAANRSVSLPDDLDALLRRSPPPPTASDGGGGPAKAA